MASFQRSWQVNRRTLNTTIYVIDTDAYLRIRCSAKTAEKLLKQCHKVRHPRPVSYYAKATGLSQSTAYHGLDALWEVGLIRYRFGKYNRREYVA
jgi:hypothetical protein